MIKVKTNIGFETTIDERILKDKRFLDALVKSQKGTDWEKWDATNAIAELLLGKDSERLCKIIEKKNDGFLPVDVYMNCIGEILKSVNELKN